MDAFLAASSNDGIATTLPGNLIPGKYLWKEIRRVKIKSDTLYFRALG